MNKNIISIGNDWWNKDDKTTNVKDLNSIPDGFFSWLGYPRQDWQSV